MTSRENDLLDDLPSSRMFRGRVKSRDLNLEERDFARLNDKDRVRFFKKIQDWILKSERIRKWILRFFTKQINPRSFGSWRVKGNEQSTFYPGFS